MLMIAISTGYVLHQYSLSCIFLTLFVLFVYSICFIEDDSVATIPSIVDINNIVLNSKSNLIPKRKKNLQNKVSLEQASHHDSSMGKDGDECYNILTVNDKKKT